METTYRYIEDETVRLDDGTDYANAILRRCKVIYGGGQLSIANLLMLDCEIAYIGDGAAAQDLFRAIHRSLHSEGFRTLHLDADGDAVAR